MSFTQKRFNSLSETIALMIDRDRIMAAQIKEHIPTKRLLECLEISADAEPRVVIVKADSGERCLLLTKERVVEAFGFWEIVGAYLKEWLHRK